MVCLIVILFLEIGLESSVECHKLLKNYELILENCTLLTSAFIFIAYLIHREFKGLEAFNNSDGHEGNDVEKCCDCKCRERWGRWCRRKQERCLDACRCGDRFFCCGRSPSLACGSALRIATRELIAVIGPMLLVCNEDIIIEKYTHLGNTPGARIAVIFSLAVLGNVVCYCIGALIGRWVECCFECYCCDKCCDGAHQAEIRRAIMTEETITILIHEKNNRSQAGPD